MLLYIPLKDTCMSNHKSLEDRIREIGEHIYSSSKAEIPSVFDKSRWIGNAVDWAMKDEDFKINLLRFIDVLPALRTDERIVSLLKEYFSDDEEACGIMKWGLKGLPAKGIVSSILGKSIKQNVEAFARQFIAGKDVEDALDFLLSLRNDGLAFGIDILGEVVVSEKEVKGYMDRYLNLLSAINTVVHEWPEDPLLDRDDKGPLSRVSISLKVSSFYSQFDPVDWEGSIENAKNNLRPLFRKAKEINAAITFDMEHYYIKDLTIALFKSMLEEEEFADGPFAGIALQTYLMDAREDLHELINWAKGNRRRISIRLVKGAYWDYEIAVNRQRDWSVPVYLNKEETDLAFEELTSLLLKNTSHISPAIASHNMRSISHAIACAESLGLSMESYEIQMLYGMAEPIRSAVKEMGCRVRIYTPLGELLPGMAYLVRRLLENTSNESFLKRSFVDSLPFDELMKPPEHSDREVKKEKESVFRNEPPLDFSKPESRERMILALKDMRKEFNKKYPLFISGEEVWKDEEITSVNPSNPDEIIGSVSLADKDDADRAVDEAMKAFSEWKNTSAQKRSEYLFKAAEEFRKKRFELAALQVHEVGKSWKEADGDVIEAIDYCNYYGHEMIKLSNSQRLGDYPGEINEYLYEPKGIGVVIAPWNFPLAISAGMVTAGIVSGNCVIYKPSGLSPVTGWNLMEVFRKAGLPEGVLQFVAGHGKEIGGHLVSHPAIDIITFTGSREVGLNIVELAGKTRAGQKNVKKVIAEMGGKNAIIVDETADIDDAVKGTLESALGYQGQKCSACSRIIVIYEVFGEFCDRLKEAMDSMNMGPPEKPGNFLGPLIDNTALQKTRSYISEGENYGKKIFSGNAPEKGYFTGPTLFVDVASDSPLAQEEIFGPVLSILQVKNIDEAIETANHT
jgi:RHH-type proline utilization regulon transcriptional repressor/proline dehydrogenase/delta 1-pyrroline-5-carboxylate dehydrogenase